MHLQWVHVIENHLKKKKNLESLTRDSQFLKVEFRFIVEASKITIEKRNSEQDQKIQIRGPKKIRFQGTSQFYTI